jgi:uncharacterized protein
VSALPRLIGVIHLPALPGSPGAATPIATIAAAAAEDARSLAAAGFDGVMVENFGDAPFFPEQVPAITVAAMTRCALAVAEASPNLALGINVLRNDAGSALSIAAVCGASMIRINVHSGARLTDQGIVNGRAHDTLRLRRELALADVALLCDVDVKHAAPLAARPIEEEALELAERAHADAVLVTGGGTGMAAAGDDLKRVLSVVQAPVYVASGVTVETAAEMLASAHGVIVGSCLRANGRAGGPIDAARAAAFVAACSR